METPLRGRLFFFSLIVGALWASERREAVATVFTLQNKCAYTVWPGTLSGNGAAVLGGGGFELQPDDAVSFTAPPGWSGRFWARTGCVFSPSGVSGSCVTGDCDGAFRCSNGGVPPVTLAEFTLAGGGNGATRDFYDVSLVDGYNVGMGLQPTPGSSGCQYAGCVADLNARCPAELRVARPTRETVACRSACEAFGGDLWDRGGLNQALAGRRRWWDGGLDVRGPGGVARVLGGVPTGIHRQARGRGGEPAVHVNSGAMLREHQMI